MSAFVRLDDRVEELGAVLLDLLCQLGGNLARAALLASPSGLVYAVMCRRSTMPVSSCSTPIGRWMATHCEPSCARSWSSVRKKSARSRSSMFTKTTRASPSVFGAVPVARGLHLDAHDAADRDERALDDVQRGDRVALEARLAGRVDEVDLAALPLEVARARPRSTSRAAARPRPSRRRSCPARRRRAGSSRLPGRASPRRARSCPCRGDRRRRRCGSFRARLRACGRSSWAGFSRS